MTINKHDTILVIDDQVDNINLIKRLLKSEDYSVTGAETSSKALHLMKNYQFDVVICDIMMPVMNGIELLNTVWALENRQDCLLIVNYPPTA